MIAALLFFTTFLVGWRCLQTVGSLTKNWWEVLFVSLSIGTILTGVSILCWVVIFGYESVWVLLVTTPLALLIPSLKAWVRTKKRADWKLLKSRLLSHHLVLVAVLCLFLWPLYSSHTFFSTSSGLFSGGSTWGDSALHATLTNWFAFQPTLDLTNPIYATEKTSYPFLIDFLAGMYRRFGLSLRASLLITSFPLALAALFLLATLVTRVSNKMTGIVAVVLLLTTGTAWGSLTALTEWRASSQPLTQFLAQMPDYASFPTQELHWSNTVSDMLLPQRGFVVGFSIWMVCAFLIATRTPKNQVRVTYMTSILIGLLPFFHIHSFGILFGLFIWMGGWAVWKKSLPLQLWVNGLVLIVACAAVPLWWQLSHTHAESFVQFKWGWFKQPSEWFVIFWLKTWGSYFIVLLAFPFLALRYLSLRKYLPLWSGLFILFLLSNCFQFQPNLYDNSKFLEAVQVFLCVVVALLLNQLWHRRAFWAAAVFSLSVVSTGTLTLIREYQLSWQIATPTEGVLATRIIELTSTEERFLTAPIHNHPVMMLAGRQTLVGYPGWLWTHGISSAEREKEVREIFTGTDRAAELLAEYQIRYVVISNHERAAYSVNEQYFADRYPVFLILGDTTVYYVGD